MAAATENLPLAFAALLAGGLLIEHGLATAKPAFAGGGSSTSSPTVAGAGTGSLSAKAKSRLNASQQQFTAELAAKTGLDINVIAAWVLAEEGGQSTAPNGPHNWLNIGATDSGFYGASNPAWQNPVSAADFTAQWLRGQSAPGFGTASSGIQAILHTAGQPPQAQISALQGSGWASGGYPELSSLYQSIL